jgi:hypothetical protein
LDAIVRYARIRSVCDWAAAGRAENVNRQVAAAAAAAQMYRREAMTDLLHELARHDVERRAGLARPAISAKAA